MEGACPTHIQAIIDHLDGLKGDSPILHTLNTGEATEVLNAELRGARRLIIRAISSEVSEWIAQYNEANPLNNVIVTPSYGYRCLSIDQRGNTFTAEVSLNYLLSISGVSFGPTMTCSQNVLVTVYRIGRGTSQAGSGFRMEDLPVQANLLTLDRSFTASLITESVFSLIAAVTLECRRDQQSCSCMGLFLPL
jgi:hypothetical protein